MHVVETVAQMRDAIKSARTRRPAGVVGLVPTMGALHAGHISLVRAARAQCDVVAASIFVNPLQFGPTEDLARYPRTFAADCEMLAAENVDFVFAPSADEMYGGDDQTTVDVGELGNRMDGASRPGHFRGVATVVAKLFNIVTPDVAFFGQKDAAQVAVLRKMVRDLNFPLRIEVCDIARESDGLAMSSRNRYLSPEERVHALVLWRALSQAKEAASRGETSANELVREMKELFAAEPMARLDYAVVVDPDTLLPRARIGREKRTLVAVAAWVGTTRLIDNILI